MLIAGFNFFIGLFNFIPLLPARRRPHRGRALGGDPPRRARGCAGRPDPGYVDVAKLLPIAYVRGRRACW